MGPVFFFIVVRTRDTFSKQCTNRLNHWGFRLLLFWDLWFNSQLLSIIIWATERLPCSSIKMLEPEVPLRCMKTWTKLSPCFLYCADELGDYFRRLRGLIEDSYTSNDNMPVVMVCHSMGCPNLRYFFSRQPQAWKDKYVRAMVTLGGAWGGAVKALKAYASGESRITCFSVVIAAVPAILKAYHTRNRLNV